MVVVRRTMSWSIRDNEGGTADIPSLGYYPLFLYSEIVNEGGTAIRHRPFLGAIFYFIVGDFANMFF